MLASSIDFRLGMVKTVIQMKKHVLDTGSC